MNLKNLETVDWRAVPVPTDDGSADHLKGMSLPDVALPSTDGDQVNLGNLRGWSALHFYPMTGRPGEPLPDGWDDIPGARGCTPRCCAFRDMSQELAEKGASAVFGISTQSTECQSEAVGRLHLPFALLSDAELQLTTALRLPAMEVDGRLLIKRLTLVLNRTQVRRVFYPVFPPDRNAADVLKFLEANQP